MRHFTNTLQNHAVNTYGDSKVELKQRKELFKVLKSNKDCILCDEDVKNMVNTKEKELIELFGIGLLN